MRDVTKDPFAVELGRRIDDAWERAGFASRAAMVRASALDGSEYNKVARWCRGASIPSVQALAKIATACRVSLDWLVFGAEYSADTFLRWLETPTGASSSGDARAFLRSLPLHGYVPTLAFYDLAHQAWKLGLTEEDAAQAAKDTERVR